MAEGGGLWPQNNRCQDRVREGDWLIGGGPEPRGPQPRPFQDVGCRSIDESRKSTVRQHDRYSTTFADALRACGSDDDVVKDRNPDQFAGFGQSLRHAVVFATRCRVARGVIVNQDDGRR